MAVPQEGYMLLEGGTNNANSTIYTSDNSNTQNLIKIGDTIKITGTASNNGVFFVSDITTDGTSLGSNGDVYYVLKGNPITSESSAGSTDPQIEVIRATGDKLVALGDVDSAGNIDVWSSNATSDYSAKDNGWTAAVIKPTLDGNNAKYIYHFIDEALRVCNINEENTSLIKWYGYIQRDQFGHVNAPVFSEWQEHPNTLNPPKATGVSSTENGSLTLCYVNSSNVGESSGTNANLPDDEHSSTATGATSANTNFYSEYRGVANQKRSAASTNIRVQGFMSSMLSSAQKTFFADLLDPDDNIFDFGGNNGDAGTTAIDSDGFVASNATFVHSGGTGIFTNSASAAGSAYLAIATVAGVDYQVGFDIISGGNSNVQFSLSNTNSWNSSAESVSVGTSASAGNKLKNAFTAVDTTSFLHIRNISTTSSQHSDLDNITVYRNNAFVFEDTSSAIKIDESQCQTGEVISIGDDLGTAPKEFLFCTKEAGEDEFVTYKRIYGGKLVGTAPDVNNHEDTPIINRGLGFNIGVSDGTADGDWETATYEFYQSFIYDGNQESLPIKMSDGDDGTNIGVGTHTCAGAVALRVSIYADFAYNGRVTGGRIYIRKQNTTDDLTLLADIDIVKGVRMTLNGNHVPWTYQSGEGYYVLGNATGNSIAPNIDTYETINGFSPDVKFLSIGGKGEMYKSSVIANRRTFVANLKIFGGSGELEKHGDRIMYSEINKFDTFPEPNFIDVSKGDYGEYTALETYADRLIAFKHNLVHIINIANPSPANWYLEDTIKYFGVNKPFSVTRTPYGVSWVNESGCFIYDGSKVSNLIEKIIGVSESTDDNASTPAWYSFARGSANVKDVMLGYDPMSNSLIMFKSPNNSSSTTNQGFIYDFDSGGWVYNTQIFTHGHTYTNFVTDWNNNLTVGKYDASSDVEFYKYLPIPVSTTGCIIITRDIDFGLPGIIKKIYSISVTYKSDNAETTPFSYAIDGKSDYVSNGGGSFTGNLVDTSDLWDVVKLTPSSPISCQSIMIRFKPNAGLYQINDMTIEYRAIKNKVVT